jgi:ADP-heptose:LPS heptosyltransferase
LKSTSCEFLAQFLLESCIAGNPPVRLPHALLEEPCAKALFGILVEGLGDRFEPALCDAYAHLFSQAIEGQDPAALVARYDRVRRTRPVACEPKRVLVLSRVTLGADVAVTSVLLAAAKQAFPKAEIVFVGPRKNFELFAADARLTHAAVEYRRGSLRDRLAVWDELKLLAADRDCLILDPDSRLTQLGLLPIGEEDRYHLFESRAYGGDGTDNLPTLTARWASETLGVSNAAPYVAVGRTPWSARDALVPPLPYIAVSLGVGENPAKRLPDPFELQLLALLSARLSLVIDKGAGGEEAARVERAAALSGARATFWDGSFAGFAQVIAGSSLYVGYDSAGQHVAAACGVPLISVFAGFPVPRMFHRWRPSGPRATVIRVDRHADHNVDQPDPREILAKVAHAIG